MDNRYEKPVVEVVSFEVKEDMMVEFGGSITDDEPF